MPTLRAEPLEFLHRAPHISSHARVIAAPRDRVFAAVVADPSTWRSWFPGLRGGGYVEPSPQGVGSGRIVQVRGMGTLRESIMAWDEPSRWVYRVDKASLPLFRALMEEWSFEDADEGATRVQWTFACDPYPWFGLALRIAPGSLERTFGRAMRNLGGELAQ